MATCPEWVTHTTVNKSLTHRSIHTQMNFSPPVWITTWILLIYMYICVSSCLCVCVCVCVACTACGMTAPGCMRTWVWCSSRRASDESRLLFPWTGNRHHNPATPQHRTGFLLNSIEVLLKIFTQGVLLTCGNEPVTKYLEQHICSHQSLLYFVLGTWQVNRIN